VAAIWFPILVVEWTCCRLLFSLIFFNFATCGGRQSISILFFVNLDIFGSQIFLVMICDGRRSIYLTNWYFSSCGFLFVFNFFHIIRLAAAASWVLILFFSFSDLRLPQDKFHILICVSNFSCFFPRTWFFCCSFFSSYSTCGCRNSIFTIFCVCRKLSVSLYLKFFHFSDLRPLQAGDKPTCDGSGVASQLIYRRKSRKWRFAAAASWKNWK